MNKITTHRKIFLDTETTGLSPEAGHRIIEIGCVELENGMRTQNNFHCYVNPELDIDEAALKVHGITAAFLNEKPLFKDIASKLITYLKGAQLIIHNAPFDIGFLNYELGRLGREFGSITDYCTVFDTLVFARKKHVGQKNNLDALCKRYGVDNTGRDLHGALLDAELLADVYLAMKTGQANLFMGEENKKFAAASGEHEAFNETKKKYRLQVIRANTQELLAHKAFMEKLNVVDSDEQQV